jgi:hypothetical protein
MSKPITPHEVVTSRQLSLPDVVFEVFNTAISDAWNGSLSTVMQKPVAAMIASRLDISTDEVYKRGYMDVEPIYRNAGWKVKYEKPGYNESGEAFFEFSKQG